MATADETIRTSIPGLEQSVTSELNTNKTEMSVDTVDIGMRRIRKFEDINSTVDVNPIRAQIYTKQWTKTDLSPKRKIRYDKNKMDLKGSLRSRMEYLKPLLNQTDYKKWRNALHRIIDLYFSDQDLHNALGFLNDTLVATISKKEKEPHEEHEVPLEDNKLPILLDKKVSEWTDLWTGLYCNYTGPDSIPDIRLSIVTVPATVSAYVLRGLSTLISALDDLHINTIKHILTMTSEKAESLLSVFKSLESGHIPVGILEPSWDLYSDIYTNCGLQKTGHKHQKHFTYHSTAQSHHYITTVYTIIYVFYYGSDVPTTSQITLV